MNGPGKARPIVTIEDQREAARCLKGKIILIDDDIEIISAFSLLLEMQGYSVEAYYNAIDYLSAAQNNTQRFPGPVCMLCDVDMPRMTGLQLQQKLSEREDHILVLISGSSSQADVVTGFREGASDFLLKPIDADELLAAVEVALEASRRVQSSRARQALIKRKFGTLTSREREVILAVASGQTNIEIGQALGIALRTVKKHRHAALLKLEVSDLPELVRLVDAFEQLGADQSAMVTGPDKNPRP
jgi:FixJ family two-component response regulator